LQQPKFANLFISTNNFKTEVQPKVRLHSKLLEWKSLRIKVVTFVNYFGSEERLVRTIFLLLTVFTTNTDLFAYK
jgi:hypothetical protein